VLNRLSSETKTQGVISATTAYSWDNNGNLIQKTTPTETTLYAWDSNNRLVEVKRGGIAANATTVASYQYDANGNRIAKTTADGKTVAYLIDSNLPFAQVAEEKSTLGTVTDTTTYLYGIERIQMTRAGQGTYYHGDGLGSTRALTDAAGNLTDSYDYDDYGALQSQTGTTKNDFLFAGEQFDVEAGLYYNRARHLDAGTGRFTGLDPFAGKLTQPITLNKYAYAGGDPVNVRDPSGKFGLSESMTAVGVSVTLNLAIDAYAGNLTSPKAVGLSVLWGTVQGVAFVGAAAALSRAATAFGPAIRTTLFRRQLAQTFALVESGGAAIGRLSSQMVLSTRAGKFLISSGNSANGITGALKHVVQDQINRNGLGAAASSEFADAMVIQELKAVLEAATEAGITYGEKMLVTTQAGITYEVIIGAPNVAGQMGRLYHLLQVF
jgi:RHS repeat-associated protein